jgi:hypothetical protein
MEILNDNIGIYWASGNFRENIKILSKENPGYYGPKLHKTWFYKKRSNIICKDVDFSTLAKCKAHEWR